MSEAAARWIGRFPPATHGTIAAYFRHSIAQGATTPAAVLMRVGVLVGDKRAWSVTVESQQLCDNLLEALVTGRAGALAFAASLLEGTAA